jgi:DNA-binding HxlR family transcriptional regulator
MAMGEMQGHPHAEPIQRITYPEVPPRVEYLFTPRGERLIELLKTIREFAARWDAGQ